MNIKDAKQQLKNSLTAYFATDEFGNYKIEPKSQRPVFLMGPPGIGKTDIVKQVAREMGIGLVSYSITHHTRQSALGLPVIETKIFDGKEYKVSEYTMSEIIASVYEMIEEADAANGILFLDEINCTSETLTPVMLQFLQFKTFGKHSLPSGWVVVTAGNPMEYNRSARDFDIVTWDRLKRIDIEADYSCWRDYAIQNDIHGSISTYLDIRKDNFYKLETTPEGARFVTVRGWMDLSVMIRLYEEHDIKVDIRLISQYVQNEEIAEDFASYYELYNKYKSDYQIEEILNGNASDDILLRARDSDFDERLSLLGLLISAMSSDFKAVIEREDVIADLLPILKRVKEGSDISEELSLEEHRYDQTIKRGAIDDKTRLVFERTIAFLKSVSQYGEDFGLIKKAYDAKLNEMREMADACSLRLRSMFRFAEEAFSDSDEMLILITELTANQYSARFISRYGCEEYFRHSDQLAFHERNLEMIEAVGKSDEWSANADA